MPLIDCSIGPQTVLRFRTTTNKNQFRMAKRIVTCYVTNTTGYDLTLNTFSPKSGSSGTSESQDHGDYDPLPTSTISNNGTQIEAFSIKQGNIFYGATGWVSYNLGGGSTDQLVLMFNNPLTQAGADSNGNCWFYAVLQGNNNNGSGSYTSQGSEGPTSASTSVQVSVSGFAFNVTDPTKSDEMTVYVTISNI